MRVSTLLKYNKIYSLLVTLSLNTITLSLGYRIFLVISLRLCCYLKSLSISVCIRPVFVPVGKLYRIEVHT